MAKKASAPSSKDELEFPSSEALQAEPSGGEPGSHIEPDEPAAGRRRSFWARMRVSRKLLVLLIFPIAGLLYFATIGSSVSTSMADLALDRMAETELTYFVGAKNIIIELQKERGTSGIFLASSGSIDQSEIAQIRVALDEKVARFREVIETHDVSTLRPEFRLVVEAAAAALAGIPEIREKVDGKKVVADDAVAQYSNIMNAILNLIGRCNELTPEPKMYSDSRALISLLRATEATAKQRYLVSAGLAFNKLPTSLQSALEGEVRDEQTRIAEFADYASEESKEELKAVLQDRATKSADAYRKMVLESNVQASFGGLTVKTWFDASTKKIDALFTVTTHIEQIIFGTVHARLRNAYTGLAISAVLVVAILLAALVPAFLISRGISRPLGQAVEALRAVADGDFSRKVEVRSDDEVGQLSMSVNDMAAQLQASQTEMARSQNLVQNAPISIMMAGTDLTLTYMNPAALETFQRLERHLPCKASELIGRPIDLYHGSAEEQRKILSNPKNLPYRAQVRLGQDWLDLLAAAVMDRDGNYLGPMVSWTVVTEQKKAKDRDLQVQAQVTAIAKDLNDNSTNLVTMSNTMAANAEENSSQANNVSAAAEQVSANVTSVAAAVEEMSATIQEVSKTVLKSSEVTQKAVQMSKQASGLVTQLGESSNEISQVTKVIASIAQQTNILALNATIEAARAGEAGKGFAVVANEVKELAKSTSKMTEDISTRIAGIQQSTSEAVLSIEEINRIMSEVDTLSATVASAVEEQSATTNEISRSMTEASTGVNEIVRNISGMATAAKDTSKQALASKEGAESLGQLAGRLQEIVELFAAANGNGGATTGNGGAKAGNGAAQGVPIGGLEAGASALHPAEGHPVLS